MMLCVARNKDNSWPEELIAVIREVEERGHEEKKNKEGMNVDSFCHHFSLNLRWY